MDPRRTISPESALASDIFDKFCSANTLKAILTHYRHLCSTLRLKPTHFPDFYPRLRAKLSSWRAQGLWSKFEKRASHKCYNRGKACYGSRVLIIGAGPCGLRTAIEAQLLGAKVVVIEKRDRFSRNNVLHLWPFVITDLKALGAKKFYGKFCAGSIDHISIRQLQCILLKVALLLGVEVLEGVGFEGLCEPTENEGWRATVTPVDHPVSHYNFDVLIGADGRRNTLDGFKRKALRAKLAIAITANFINKHTEAEARVKEISGVSYIFNQKFFQELNEATGIDLENIVYYKDETHYFVMTAKKQSLLNKGVLLQDHADTAKLLSHDNISSEALMIYALEAAIFSTENQLPNLEFAVNHYGQPDVAMFDFTAMYAAENACRVVQRKGHKLLMSLVGDSLLEPFWPTGSGCARGFLSSFDACWMLRSWASGAKSILEVIAERESIYRLLGQTTPENLNKEHMGYTIDPYSRYPNLNVRVVMPFQVKSLHESDETDVADFCGGHCEQLLIDAEKVSKKRRRDSVIAVDSLLSWVRDQVTGYGLEVSDVCDAFIRGDVLCAIINRFRPDLIEFPLPSEENVDPLDIAACRNQIAFDLLHEEHGLSPIMSGFDSVQCTSSDFLTIVAYLSQIYEVFRGEIPQIKYPRVENSEDLEDLEPQRSSHSHPKQHGSRPALAIKHVSGKSLNRRSRVSSSGRDGRAEGDSESSRKHKKRRSEDRSRAGTTEERDKRRQDIDKNRVERQRRLMQERIIQTERFVKSMRLLQLNDRSGEISVSDDNDERFEDYTFHLYRQMVPDFDERVKYLERKLFNSGREIKASGSHAEPDKQNVTGLTRNLEEKLKGSKHVEKKPKDLIRAIGKIEKSDWNVQLIEKKIAESKTHCPNKKERDDKVPKWSKEAFDDKREAMKRKMEGSGPEKASDKLQQFEDQVKKLGSKLKEGNALEVGQRGSNKVSQMASQLVHKLERPKEDLAVNKIPVQRPVFEFPKKGGSETCHFCNERVYVVERMTAEGRFFHRNCFRCEYCNTSLRLGNYVFDREGRYGERFYCTPHYGMIRLYGWKKYDQDGVTNEAKFAGDGANLLTPTNQQILSLENPWDERGTTPERVEFENSVDFASEEELLSEMDEDEWTDRNFGVSNADNNTSDEASDLSDDEDDVTPEGTEEQHHSFPGEQIYNEDAVLANNKAENSDSDTEIASGEEYDEDATGDEEEDDEDDEEEDCEGEEDGDGEEEEEDEEEEDDCGGSTTEIETDSEFAEDPPHSVPGNIPTIVVDEPEQLVTRIIEPTPLSHTHSRQTPKQSQSGKSHHHRYQQKPLPKPPEELVDILQYRMVEPVKRNIPERVLPRVNPVPKKWEPLPLTQDHHLASKMSLELKQKYLHGVLPNVALGTKKVTDSTAQNQFRSVLDMISEKQKLLQPAAKPSATMQAFLDGAEKLKMKQSVSPLSGTVPSINAIGGFSSEPQSPFHSSGVVGHQSWSPKKTESTNDAGIENGKNLNLNGEVNLINMNRLNLEKNIEITGSSWDEDKEKCDFEKEILSGPVPEDAPNVILSDVANEGVTDCLVMVQSDTPSFSQSETTETQSTIIGTHKHGCADGAEDIEELTHSQPEQDKSQVRANQEEVHSNPEEDQESESEEGSDTESVDPLSESDDIDADIEVDCIHVPHKPPRVEIEDEFGVTLKIDEDFVQNKKSIQSDIMSSAAASSESALEDDGCKSIGMSSSDSKDSLNSGMFLETEMSDWTRDGEGHDGGVGTDDQRDGNRKKKCNKNKSARNRKLPQSYNQHQNENEDSEKYSKLKASLTLDLASLDFMDVDGVSSPEDILIIAPKKQGYCKLANEEVDSDNDMGHCGNFQLDGNTCDKLSSSASSRESTPTVGSVQNSLGFTNATTPPSVSQDNTPIASKSEQDFVEAINPIVETQVVHEQPSVAPAMPIGKEKYAILDRVVPFSNARDSLDYRKMKSNTSSPVKSKDLFSSYSRGHDYLPLTVENFNSISNNTFSSPLLNHPQTCKPKHSSVARNELDQLKTTAINELFETVTEQNSDPALLQVASVNSDGSDTSKSSTSPNTVRRIEEINKERAKQSDLIRSMVMGRLLRSPEKNRRNSRGSLSPFGASASSSSGSGSSEQFIRPSSEDHDGDTENDSRRSSQHSILSNSNAEANETEEDESQSVNNSSDFIQDPIDVGSSGDVSQASLSTNSKDIGSLKDESEQPTDSKMQIVHTPAHYEPVFTSSPRFRNRPKFDSPLSIYSSVTNPPTPVNPVPNLFTPVTPDLSSPTKSESSQQDSKKRNKSPSFYRSMPDLTSYLTSSNGGFSTPNVRQWEAYKSASMADREKARQAARERARLKSDQELGLDQTDYIIYKDKLRRKISVPEDDVFDPNAAVVVSSIITPKIPPSFIETPTTTKKGGERARPMSDVFDNVASSIRHNVDFPIAKTNPFLVSPDAENISTSLDIPPKGDSLVAESCDEEACSLGPRKTMETDDFVHLQLRINSKHHTPERKVSPEKARSVGWDTIPDSFPNYFTPASSQPPSFSSIRSDPNWGIDKQESHRPRSNTFSDSHISLGKSRAGNSYTNQNMQSPSTAALVSATSVAAGTYIANPSTKIEVPLKPKPSKSKALSSDMLLDDSPLSTPSGEAPRGASVPDITRDPSSPERKTKKPKDRERRRSIIQAVSDFFSSRSSNNGSSVNNSISSPSPENEKANGSPLQNKDKFSLFKLTPKLLQKDRRTSKSRESFSPIMTSSAGSDSSPPAKPARSGFISYLSQPDMVIQRLSASPTPFKSSRVNLNSRNDSICSTPHSGLEDSLSCSTPPITWTNSVASAGENSPRIKEIQEIGFQLESIESEQRKLEIRGVSIEKKLKGEEKDNENRDDVELMEEWFTLVREKTRLARLERELIVKSQKLQLEERQSLVQDKLDQSVNLCDVQKTPDQKSHEIVLINELHSLEKQKGNLLSKYHEDIQNYEAEDAELEAKIASSSLSPRESNV